LVGGSGRGREWGSFEEDMCVDERVGEGVEMGDGVDVTLVGDVSSIVLEGGERAFSDGAVFVDVFEVCGGSVEVESVVVIEVDDPGASVGFPVAKGTGEGISSMRTEPFLSSIAFLLVEPGSSGLHFESSGTEEFAIWGVGVVENVVSSGVDGDVGFSPLVCDVLVDIPGVEGSIGEEEGGFESIGEEFVEEGRNAGDIGYIGSLGGFGQDDESDARGSSEDRRFEPPEEPGELLSFGIFVGGGFGAETGIGVAFGDGVFVPSILDELLGVVLTDVCPDLFDITGYCAIEEIQAFDLLDGLLQEDLEEGILHPLDLRSEVSIGGDDLFPRWGRGGKVDTLFLGLEADGEGQCRMVQEEASQLGEGGNLLIDHDEVGFEEGFERDAGGGACGEEGEVKDVEETLVSSDQGIVLDPVV
jgi:hypothetical protein